MAPAGRRAGCRSAVPHRHRQRSAVLRGALDRYRSLRRPSGSRFRVRGRHLVWRRLWVELSEPPAGQRGGGSGAGARPRGDRAGRFAVGVHRGRQPARLSRGAGTGQAAIRAIRHPARCRRSAGGRPGRADPGGRGPVPARGGGRTGGGPPDPSLPEPFVLEPGSIIEPDVEYPYRLYVHCGIEWLGSFNNVTWRADLPDGSLGGVPPEWESAMSAGRLTVELSIILRTDPEPTITATANGYMVTYRPTTELPPGCD